MIHGKSNHETSSIPKSMCVHASKNCSVEFTFIVNDDAINKSDIELALVTAGKVIGLGDWRPRYGTFHVDSFKQSE